MIDILQEPEEVPQIVVLGPPGAGKRTISRMLADKLNCVYICQDHFTDVQRGKFDVALKERIEKHDCVDKGWLLEDIPSTRQQALFLQASGIFPKHVVLLEAPDTVLIERVMGKRIDKLTGDVYHVTFDPASKADVQKCLVEDPNCKEEIMVKRLSEFHRNIDGILRCYENKHKAVNADQPKCDVFSQTLSYLNMRQRSCAPHTPRVLLLGPPGSGKSVQAALLASKYHLLNICFDELVKQTLANDSELGETMKPYAERGVTIPDELLIKCLVERLGQLDATKRGWVLHGFPSTRMQVDAMIFEGYEPNRVIVLDVPNDIVVERLSLRAVDPVSGERYHILYNPPRTNEIKQRLKTHPDDEESNVLCRCADYQVNIEDMLEFYTDAQRINADQDHQSVFECIETIIVNPLPNSMDK